MTTVQMTDSDGTNPWTGVYQNDDASPLAAFRSAEFANHWKHILSMGSADVFTVGPVALNVTPPKEEERAQNMSVRQVAAISILSAIISNPAYRAADNVVSIAVAVADQLVSTLK